jgi:hypothetical protein
LRRTLFRLISEGEGNELYNARLLKASVKFKDLEEEEDDEEE